MGQGVQPLASNPQNTANEGKGFHRPLDSPPPSSSVQRSIKKLKIKKGVGLPSNYGTKKWRDFLGTDLALRLEITARRIGQGKQEIERPIGESPVFSGDPHAALGLGELAVSPGPRESGPRDRYISCGAPRSVETGPLGQHCTREAGQSSRSKR